ncbi:Transcriptional regulator of fatty acid biosynthesis FabT [Streptococcus oralis]|uniref:Transcriptional regulator of fatty acid biosynthesis FabT n=2 Tax=Streptococcus TaxID=1301 RepID=A0A139QRR0_STROR|nr:Transcriptional regulator of fatty acid biosynthesis FabT [Streptococcus oralis]
MHYLLKFDILSLSNVLIVKVFFEEEGKSLDYQRVNDYLTSIFNNVLVIEEVSLRGSRFKDISIKEMHTIDVIGKFPEATPSKVSKELMVTLGTVTTSLNNLERKGYIERIRSDQDRRVVYLHLTKKGRLVHRLHKRFHKAMVEKIIDGMSPEEMDVMGKGLTNLYQFLEDLK